jgi:hypothetical protein
MAAQLQYTIAAGVKRPRQDDRPAATVLMDASVYPVKPSLPRSTSGKPLLFLVPSRSVRTHSLITCPFSLWRRNRNPHTAATRDHQMPSFSSNHHTESLYLATTAYPP